ncbi:hypothetical protein PR048_012503 [Dryococelus australis]|uniref:Uncharacterized protein n=1 Tax=Dryococelus australis TaxID=614101 RepID=A0ABQ9HPK8_9NEOP|nr:hypothetical protein PR048_012503 [Dryococelus australis]
MKGRGNWEIPEKAHRPTASSGTIPTCEYPVTRQGTEPGSPWWEVSVLIAQPPRPYGSRALRLVATVYLMCVAVSSFSLRTYRLKRGKHLKVDGDLKDGLPRLRRRSTWRHLHRASSKVDDVEQLADRLVLVCQRKYEPGNCHDMCPTRLVLESQYHDDTTLSTRRLYLQQAIRSKSQTDKTVVPTVRRG